MQPARVLSASNQTLPPFVQIQPTILSATGPQEPNQVANQLKARQLVQQILSKLKENDPQAIIDLMKTTVIRAEGLNSATLYNFAILSLLEISNGATTDTVNLGEILNLFHDMLRNDLMPTSHTLNGLIVALCKNQQPGIDQVLSVSETNVPNLNPQQAFLAAISIWKSLDSRAAIISETALLSLLNASVSIGTREIADEIFEIIRTRLPQISSARVQEAILSYAKLLVNTGSVEALEALALEVSTFANGIALKQRINTDRITALVIAKKNQQAIDLIELLSAENTASPVQEFRYRSELVLALAKSKQWQLAFDSLSNITSLPHLINLPEFTQFLLGPLITSTDPKTHHLQKVLQVLFNSKVSYPISLAWKAFEEFIDLHSSPQTKATTINRIERTMRQDLETGRAFSNQPIPLNLLLKLVYINVSTHNSVTALQLLKHYPVVLNCESEQVLTILTAIIQRPHNTLKMTLKLASLIQNLSIESSKALALATVHFLLQVSSSLELSPQDWQALSLLMRPLIGDEDLSMLSMEDKLKLLNKISGKSEEDTVAVNAEYWAKSMI